MAYLLIPQPTDQLSVSQGQLLGNFVSADATFAINHGGFVSGNGKHTKLQMPNQVTNTVPTLATEAGLYSAQGLTSGTSELFFVRQGYPGGAPGANASNIAFTETMNGGAMANSNGWTRLPSGIILQWGYLTSVNPSSAAVFPIPFTQACYSVQLTWEGAPTFEMTVGVVDGSRTPMGFSFFAASPTDVGRAGQHITYFAIGL